MFKKLYALTAILLIAGTLAAQWVEPEVEPAQGSSSNFAPTYFQPPAWYQMGNLNTNPSIHYLGTQDNKELNIKVNSKRALLIQPNSTSPNIVGGYYANNAGSGIYGVSIGGGGRSGAPNSVQANYGAIGGGSGHTVSGYGGSIAGGLSNTVEGYAGFVGGGRLNQSSNFYSGVSAGYSNEVSNNFSYIGGGYNNTANGYCSYVGSGYENSAGNDYVVISGGRSNASEFKYTVIGGGYNNTITNQYSTICGGYYNHAGEKNVSIGGGWYNEATGASSTVSGGNTNSASDLYCTVGGGHGNAAHGTSATIAGGSANDANYYSAIGGGSFNTARGYYAALAGGYNNLSGDSPVNHYASVGGGAYNRATGYAATIPGGYDNLASGNYTFAAGRRAKAPHCGSFVWGDMTDADISTTSINQFRVRVSGGVWFYTNATLTTGVYLASGSGSWSSVSDKNVKENFSTVDGAEILTKVADLPITTWNYKSQDEKIRHIGPMAQDFHAAFGVGDDDKHLTTVDVDGITLASIQALYAENQELKAQLQDQQEYLESLEARLEALEAGR